MNIKNGKRNRWNRNRITKECDSEMDYAIENIHKKTTDKNSFRFLIPNKLYRMRSHIRNDQTI